jgi:hypothetical protein
MDQCNAVVVLKGMFEFEVFFGVVPAVLQSDVDDARADAGAAGDFFDGSGWAFFGGWDEFGFGFPFAKVCVESGNGSDGVWVDGQGFTSGMVLGSPCAGGRVPLECDGSGGIVFGFTRSVGSMRV